MPSSPTGPECPVCGYPLEAQPCGRCGGTAFHPGSVEPMEPGRGLFLTDMIHGFAAYWRGAVHMFTRPEYHGKLWLPVTVNLLAVALLGVGVWYGVDLLYQWWGIAEWAESCWVGSAALKVLLFLVLLWFLGAALTELVTAPFLDGLAETAEVTVGGKGMAGNSIGFVRSIAVGIKQALQLLLLQILLLPLGILLATVLQPVGPFLAMALSAYVTALVWFEFPFLRRDQKFARRRHVLQHNWAMSIGFGLAFQTALAVPLFNLLFLTPAAAVGASELYFRMDKREAGKRVG